MCTYARVQGGHQCLKSHTVITAFTGTEPETGVLYPHGNTQKSSPHISTAPSVPKETGETYKAPSVHYKEKVAGSTVPATHNATLKPRNPRQVKMHRRRLERTEDSYTLDDLFNLVELMYDIQDYTYRMLLVPELGVVLAHRAMLQEVLAVLCVKGSIVPTRPPAILRHCVTDGRVKMEATKAVWVRD